jgi:hypothetical protein
MIIVVDVETQATVGGPPVDGPPLGGPRGLHIIVMVVVACHHGRVGEAVFEREMEKVSEIFYFPSHPRGDATQNAGS